ncbi:MAG TPA: hypothetical protein VHV09_10005 [Trebonia sp.]|nr:hypothetical protein [Trebonia sp.]
MTGEPTMTLAATKTDRPALLRRAAELVRGQGPRGEAAETAPPREHGPTPIPQNALVSPETERLVCARASYRCEACARSLFNRSLFSRAPGPDPCVIRVVRLYDRPIPADVMAGPANAVLLCGACASGVIARAPVMGVRGFWADDVDPRLVPMAVAFGESLAALWRSTDGRYLTEPPEGAVGKTVRRPRHARKPRLSPPEPRAGSARSRTWGARPPSTRRARSAEPEHKKI